MWVWTGCFEGDSLLSSLQTPSCVLNDSIFSPFNSCGTVVSYVPGAESVLLLNSPSFDLDLGDNTDSLNQSTSTSSVFVNVHSIFPHLDGDISYFFFPYSSSSRLDMKEGSHKPPPSFLAASTSSLPSSPSMSLSSASMPPSSPSPLSSLSAFSDGSNVSFAAWTHNLFHEVLCNQFLPRLQLLFRELTPLQYAVPCSDSTSIA